LVINIAPNQTVLNFDNCTKLGEINKFFATQITMNRHWTGDEKQITGYTTVK